VSNSSNKFLNKNPLYPIIFLFTQFPLKKRKFMLLDPFKSWQRGPITTDFFFKIMGVKITLIRRNKITPRSILILLIALYWCLQKCPFSFPFFANVIVNYPPPWPKMLLGFRRKFPCRQDTLNKDIFLFFKSQDYVRKIFVFTIKLLQIFLISSEQRSRKKTKKFEFKISHSNRKDIS
jgi:hypothetical protein